MCLMQVNIHRCGHHLIGHMDYCENGGHGRGGPCDNVGEYVQRYLEILCEECNVSLPCNMTFVTNTDRTCRRRAAAQMGLALLVAVEARRNPEAEAPRRTEAAPVPQRAEAHISTEVHHRYGPAESR